MAGDLNSRHPDWGDSVRIDRGLYLDKWLRENNLKYRAQLKSSSELSYPKSGAYINLCIHDVQLGLTNLQNNRIRTMTFDSDHLTLVFQTYFVIGENLDFVPHTPQNSLNFNLTNWQPFNTSIGSTKVHISYDRNLDNDEINKYLKELEKFIQTAPQKGQRSH